MLSVALAVWILTVTMSAAPSLAAGDLVFDASFEEKRKSAYHNVIHRERISIVDDPVLGTIEEWRR